MNRGCCIVGVYITQSYLHATVPLAPLKHPLNRRVRLVSLAAQNFLAGVINDTLQARRKCGADLF